MVKVLPCQCAHTYQDARYGAGLRVHNRCAPKSLVPTWRCTICQVERVTG